MKKKIICSIIYSLLLSFLPRANAAHQRAFDLAGHLGGKSYSVKLYKHTCDTATTVDDAFYILVGAESGLHIYTNDETPLWVNDFPDPTVSSYNGGASGRNIDYFKTGIDAATINDPGNNPTDYAFYADGQKLYVLDISDVSNDISIASSYTLPNVRAVKVAPINGNWFAFALAFWSAETPGTTKLSIFDVNDPTDITLLGSVDLDRDDDHPNTEGGCDMVFIADFNNDGEASDPYLFIADGTEGIKSLNLTPLYFNSTHVYSIDPPNYITTGGIALGIDLLQINSSLYAFVADGSGGLKAYDVSTPASMALKGSLAFACQTGYSGVAYDVQLFGTTAFIAHGRDGLRVADVSDPNNPVDITFGYNGGQLSYIDSDVSNDRLGGTAYDVTLDVSSDAANSRIYPIVAWGEAGMRKVKMKYCEIDTSVGTDGNASFGKIVDFISDGTYIWLLDATGRLTRITPGKNMSIVTTTNQIFSDVTNDVNGVWGNNIIGNIVSCGDYIYGVDDESMDAIARVKKSTFSAASLAQCSKSKASDYTNDLGTCRVAVENYILRLFTNGTDVFFLDYDLSNDPTLQFTSEGEIGRLDIDNFSESPDMIETSARIFDTTADISQLKLVVTDDYIYGICYGKGAQYGDGSADCVCQIRTNFTPSEKGVSDDTYKNASTLDICGLVADANNICAVDETGDIIKYSTSQWSSTTPDAVRNILNHFQLTSTKKLEPHVYTPLFIQDNYLYGRKKDVSNCLSRVQLIDFSESTTSESANISIPYYGDIAFITGDGHDIYIFKDETGCIYKVAADRFNTTSDITSDGIMSETAYFREADASTDSTSDTTHYIALAGYVFGVDDVSNDVLVEVGFRSDETDDKVSVKAGKGSNYEDFCGYARDVYLNIDHSSDVFIADGDKGIVKITFERPTDASADSGKWFLTRLNDVDGRGEISGDADIRDARGLDFIKCTDDYSADSVLLVADGEAGVKLVRVANVPDAMSIRYDSSVSNGHGNGYIMQPSLGNGVAEDIKSFQFNKDDLTDTHEYAAVANGSAGVVILDLDFNKEGTTERKQADMIDMGDMTGDTETPRVINTNGYAYGLAIDKKNDYIYVADGSNGLVVIDLDPNNIKMFGESNQIIAARLLNNQTSVYSEGSPYTLRSVVLDDPNSPSYAYLAYGSKGVVILDLTEPNNYSCLGTYPESGQIDGAAYDLVYEGITQTLYVAMKDGELLALDVADPENILVKGGLDIYGTALGITYGDVDGTADASTPPHIYIANGPGGFLSASVKSQPRVIAVIPNIQPVSGGDTIKVIGSGFKQGYTSITISDGTDETTVPAAQVTCNSGFELTFPAPHSPSGLSGEFTVYVNRTDYNSTSTESISLNYLSSGQPIIALSAGREGVGMAAPGANLPINLLLRTNGAGKISAVTARIVYDSTFFDVSTDNEGNVPSSVFRINEGLEKEAHLLNIDSDPTNDTYKTLNITIINESTGVNAEIPDGINIGTVYFKLIVDDTSTDIALWLDNGPLSGEIQQVSTVFGDSITAIGSKTYVYVKAAPQYICMYTEKWYEVDDSSNSFGPFIVTVSEHLDSSSYVEGAEITFEVDSNNAVTNVNNLNRKASFTVTQGTLQSMATDGTSVTVSTNAGGKAAVTLEVGTKAGEYIMNISGVYNGLTLTGYPATPIQEQFNVYAETDANDPNDSISLSLTDPNVSAGGSVIITATAYDKYGNPLGAKSASENLAEQITFSTNGYGTLSAYTAFTDSNGQVHVTYKLENSVATHIITASYDDTTSASIILNPVGPDVNLNGAWDEGEEGLSDLLQAIVYHKKWTYLDPEVADAAGYKSWPGDTNGNERMDLNEVVAIINLMLGIIDD
ncbi:MAG: hypothetical protein ACMUJM_05785 [bacterium]